jgi:hypothetical protein
MASPSRALTLGLGALICVVLAAGVVAAATDDGRAAMAEATSSTSTTTPTTAPRHGATTTSHATSTTTTSTGPTTTTTPGDGTSTTTSTTAPPARAIAPALTIEPTAPGTYEAKVTGQQDGGETRSWQRTYSVERLASLGGQTRRAVRNRDGGVRQDIRWAPDGARLERLIVGDGDAAHACDLRPDPLLLPKRLAAGKRWSSKGACAIPADQGGGSLHYSVTGRVVGLEEAAVGKARTRVARVELTTTIRVDSGDTHSVERVDAVSLIPSDGLVVRRRLTSTWEMLGAPQPRRLTETEVRSFLAPA